MLNKKNILCATVAGLAGLLVAANASAAADGAYVGGQFGVGAVHQSGLANSKLHNAYNALHALAPTNTALRNTSDNDGIAGRIFAGYQFTQNFAAELGFTQFHNATEKESLNGRILQPISINTTETIKTNAVDLVGKGILPLQTGLNLYGKLGVAYVTQNVSDKTTEVLNGVNVSSSIPKSDVTNHKFYPTFGAGVSYDLTQNLSSDLSWTRIQKVGSSSSIPSSDFVGLGLSYHFG